MSTAFNSWGSTESRRVDMYLRNTSALARLSLSSAITAHREAKVLLPEPRPPLMKYSFTRACLMSSYTSLYTGANKS